MAIVERLVGVYDADGTLRGELTYWVGARLGRAHCALCDITHGSVREKREWQAWRARLPVPFVTVHRDEVPPAVAALGVGPPYVAAETDGDVVLLLDGAAVDNCRADPEALVTTVEVAVEAKGLLWPAADPHLT